jgi:hypothetical protein
MDDTITQNRLSLRLEKYMSDFAQKNLGKDHLSRAEWETVWNAAESARTNKTLTPELVDDVRRVVNKLEQRSV